MVPLANTLFIFSLHLLSVVYIFTFILCPTLHDSEPTPSFPEVSGTQLNIHIDCLKMNAYKYEVSTVASGCLDLRKVRDITSQQPSSLLSHIYHSMYIYYEIRSISEVIYSFKLLVITSWYLWIMTLCTGVAGYYFTTQAPRRRYRMGKSNKNWFIDFYE